MKHPFEEILTPETSAATQPTRRSALGRALGVLAGLFGLGGTAAAQTFMTVRPTTYAYGEEGGRVTTFAYGEEGGKVTTFALGEEGGRWPSPSPPTTLATGEEGGKPWPKPPGRWPTTLAYGEEGGGVTTFALGEEGGRR